MEDIEAATAPPQAPPAPTTRWAAAPAPASGLLALAAGTFGCYFLVVLWVSNAANAAAIAVRWSCGEDSRAAAVALEFTMDCSVALGFLPVLPVLLLLLLWRLQILKAKPREILIGGDGGAKKPTARLPRPESTGASCCLCGLYDPIPVPFVVLLFIVMAVGLLMQELAPAKGSTAERVGSLLVDIFVFIHAVIFCFAIFPNIVIGLRASCTKLSW